MRFLSDQILERRASGWLKAQGHDVTIGVVDYDGRLPDPTALALAVAERCTLITSGKNFGELI